MLSKKCDNMYKKNHDLKTAERLKADADNIEMSVVNFIRNLDVEKKTRGRALPSVGCGNIPTMGGERKKSNSSKGRYYTSYKFDASGNKTEHNKILDKYYRWYSCSESLVNEYLPQRNVEFKECYEHIKKN